MREEEERVEERGEGRRERRGEKDMREGEERVEEERRGVRGGREIRGGEERIEHQENGSSEGKDRQTCIQSLLQLYSDVLLYVLYLWIIFQRSTDWVRLMMTAGCLATSTRRVIIA